MTISKKEAKKEIAKLVERFKMNLDQYKKPTYKETPTRTEYINKFFIALGWDVTNKEGRAQQYREVAEEDSLRVGSNIKAPDYSFRIGGKRIFLVEAKKPSTKIKVDVGPAFQLRRYAWNAKIPLSILTDFEELAVYDCRSKPNQKDSASSHRVLYLTFNQYLEDFDRIYDVFSKEAVLKGSFDRFVESTKDKRGTGEVDDEFLKEIERWRDLLAKNIALRNQDLTIQELNFCVQKIIDRILFLRMAEDKSIERYGRLREIAEREGSYKELLKYFKHADEKYNSGIFDFGKDKLTPKLMVDDILLKKIAKNLYYPHSPYDFSVINVELLGSVYEEFLGKTIKLTKSHKAKIEEKPEVKKKGGVYYTPEWVVDYIVKKTVGRLVKGKNPTKIKKIRILDPACGSGTFLVRAYDYLLNYHLEWYLKNNPKKHKKQVYQVRENQWFLTTAIKKQILINNIFGVDIDPQAVEITKLSLLLKVLENETKEIINQQMKLFQERALPNLEKNIRCGNSLVDSSYFSQTALDELDIAELSKINPFDWEDKEKGFGKILEEGRFDIIIGNPPYVKEYTNKEVFETVKKTNLTKYYLGKMDFWYFFTCKAIDLLKENGFHSFIAQNNWITSSGASILRDKILEETKILSFFDFNVFKVFKNASIQTMVFVLEKKKPRKSYSVDYCKVKEKKISKSELVSYLSEINGDNNAIESFKAKILPKELVGKTINFVNSELSDILNKIKERSNYKLEKSEISTGIDVHQDFVSDKHLKILKDTTINKGNGIFNLSNQEYKGLNLCNKERDILKPFYTSQELFRYYGTQKNNLWIIYSDINVRKNIDAYPHIKKHLDKFKKIITSDFKPYGLHRAREQNFFEGEKITSLRKTAKPCFTYTDFPCYVSQSYFIIKPENINPKYLVGLLNSNLIFFWLKFKGKRQGDLLQVDKAPLLDLPLMKAKKQEEEIVKYVDILLKTYKDMKQIRFDNEKEIYKKKIKALEKGIDELIYKIYGITEKEKKIIEESLK